MEVPEKLALIGGGILLSSGLIWGLKSSASTILPKISPSIGKIYNMANDDKKIQADQQKAQDQLNEAQRKEQAAQKQAQRAKDDKSQLEAQLKQARSDWRNAINQKDHLDSLQKQAQEKQAQADSARQQADNARQVAEAKNNDLQDQLNRAQANTKQSDSDKNSAQDAQKQAQSAQHDAEAKEHKAKAKQSQADADRQNAIDQQNSLQDQLNQAQNARKQAESTQQQLNDALHQAQIQRDQAEKDRQAADNAHQQVEDERNDLLKQLDQANHDKQQAQAQKSQVDYDNSYDGHFHQAQSDNWTTGHWGSVPYYVDDEYGVHLGSGKPQGSLANALGNDVVNTVNTVKIEGNIQAPEDSSKLFANLSNVHYINGLANVNTSEVSNMVGIFSDDVTLDQLNGIKDWDVHNVTNTSEAFMGTFSKLANNLDLSGWNTPKLTDASGMFKSIGPFHYKLNIANLDTTHANTDDMFGHWVYGDSHGVTSIDQITVGPNTAFGYSAGVGDEAGFRNKYTGQLSDDQYISQQAGTWVRV